MARARRATRAAFENIGDAAGHSSEEEEFMDEVKLEIPQPARFRPKKEPTDTVESSSRNRAENLRDRIQLFYGSSDAELNRAIELRVKWGHLLFSLDPEEREPIKLASKELSSEAPVNNPLLSSFVSPLFPLKEGNVGSGHPCVVENVLLEPHESRRSTDVCILNVGYAVTSVDWRGNLLAVGVRMSPEAPIDLSSIFTPEEGDSLVHIYEVEGSQVDHSYSITVPNGGTVRQVAWRPGTQSSAELCLVLGNGSIAIAEVGSMPGKVARLEPIPLLATLDVDATCIEWRTPNDLIVGYEDGHVAEFFFPAESTLPLTPSFVARAHSSVVTSIATSLPNSVPNSVGSGSLFTTSVDGWSCVYKDVSDLRYVTRVPRLRFYASCACYVPVADSFMCLEDADTTRLVPWRCPDLVQAQTALTRHKAGVSAVAATSFHPLVVSGGHDGELHITNPLRRTLVTRRNRDIHLDCTAWRLECSHKTSSYRFVDVLSVSSLEKRKVPSHLTLYPSPVTISSIAWRPQSSWYAAGTAAGLIRIERI